ncbi:hypothetical protein HanRHA438_Chr06g0287161 [Helianthus annuus]|nr:hypothetical protein HanRHA438_Chr06g0287161 [Helianthus annuus]
MWLCMMACPFEVFVVVFENIEVFLPFRSIDRTGSSIGRLNRLVRYFSSKSSAGCHLIGQHVRSGGTPIRRTS